jgi:hypothetical protein
VSVYVLALEAVLDIISPLQIVMEKKRKRRRP